MRTKSRAGEVWLADLGMVQKTRPVLVLHQAGGNDARMLVVVAPLTSQVRGMRGEVLLGHPRWLPKLSAVNVQGLASFDPSKLIRKMGTITALQLGEVKAALRELLEL